MFYKYLLHEESFISRQLYDWSVLIFVLILVEVMHDMDNFRMDVKVISASMKNWFDLPQDRDYWRNFKSSIEPQGYISHEVN